MNDRIHYQQCPLCGSTSIRDVLVVKDHSVSQELFPIGECSSCTLRFTQDIPGPDSISSYYKSEDYISHTNTSRGLINSLYQAIRKRTMGGKRKLVQNATGMQNGKLLDIGSGTGTFVSHMKSHGWNVTGLEPDPGARSVASQTYQVELERMERFLSLEPANFDVITLWHVLEHVHDPHGYVRQLRILLKEKGKLIIAVPNYTSKDASIYKDHWAAYDVPRHLFHFSPEAMETLVTMNGLKIEAFKPMWFDSFYISLLSSKYRRGRSNLPGAFWNGLRSNLAAINNVKKCSSLTYIISK